MKKILFISHDGNRAGAQILLMRFLQLLKDNQDFTFKILVKDDGPLSRGWDELAPTFHWYYEPVRKHIDRVLGRQTHRQQILSQLRKEHFDLVVSNTVTNGPLLAELRGVLTCPIVTYAHEMPMGIATYTSREGFRQTLRYSDAFWACSEAQRQVYIERFGILPEAITVLPSLLPMPLSDLSAEDDTGRSVRQSLGIPAGAPLIGACGTFDWRKGIDLFVQAARQAPEHLHWLWIGVNEGSAEYKMMQEDLRRLGLAERVHLLPHTDRPLEYLAALDVFVLTSREEPYPLVVLEAATLSKPIVCFAQSGGAPDFVGEEAGVVCPYLDVACMSRSVGELAENQQLRTQLGRQARQKVLRQHADAVAMQAFASLLNRYAQ